MPNQRERDAEQTVKGWGFEHVFTWRDGPYELPSPPADPKHATEKNKRKKHKQMLMMVF